jgi:hypothetical protein
MEIICILKILAYSAKLKCQMVAPVVISPSLLIAVFLVVACVDELVYVCCVSLDLINCDIICCFRLNFRCVIPFNLYFVFVHLFVVLVSFVRDSSAYSSASLLVIIPVVVVTL